MQTVKRKIGFLRTTAIGGLLFLLPLIVLGALIGQLAPIVMAVATALYGILPLKTPGGIAILLLIALALVILLCFAAGVLAKRSIGQKISNLFEKNITMLIPRYTIIKEQMKGSIGGEELRSSMKPIIAKMDDCWRVGFEMERQQGHCIAVYLPGSPDPWNGQVVFLPPDRVQPLGIEFSETLALFDRLGRGGAEWLAAAAIPLAE